MPRTTTLCVAVLSLTREKPDGVVEMTPISHQHAGAKFNPKSLIEQGKYQPLFVRRHTSITKIQIHFDVSRGENGLHTRWIRQICGLRWLEQNRFLVNCTLQHVAKWPHTLTKLRAKFQPDRKSAYTGTSPLKKKRLHSRSGMPALDLEPPRRDWPRSRCLTPGGAAICAGRSVIEPVQRD